MEHIIPPSVGRHLDLSRCLSPRRDYRHRFTMPPPAANGGGGCLSERSFSTRWYPWSAIRSMPPPSTSGDHGLTPSLNKAVDCLIVSALNSERVLLRVHRLSLDPEQIRPVPAHPVPASRRKRCGKEFVDNA